MERLGVPVAHEPAGYVEGKQPLHRIDHEPYAGTFGERFCGGIAQTWEGNRRRSVGAALQARGVGVTADSTPLGARV